MGPASPSCSGRRRRHTRRKPWRSVKKRAYPRRPVSTPIYSIAWTASATGTTLTGRSGSPTRATGEAKALTSGDFTCGDLCWSPDGARLAFLSDRRPDWDAETEGDTQIWTVPVGGRRTHAESLPRSVKKAGSPGRRTGSALPMSATPTRWTVGGRATSASICCLSRAARRSDLTGGLDKAVGFLTLSDARDNGGQLVAWSADAQRLFFPVSENGSTRLYTAPAEGGDLPIALTPAGQELGSFSVSQGSTSFALTLGTATKPHEVFIGLLDGETLSVRQVSDTQCRLARVKSPCRRRSRLRSPTAPAARSPAGS